MIEKKKLLIATDSFFPRLDGVSRFLSEIIPRLAKTYNITVLAPAFPGKSRKQKARVIRFTLIDIQFGDIYFANPNLKQIKEEVKKADIVWIQSIGTIGASTVHYAYKYNKPAIAYIHSIEWELTANAVKRFKRLAGYISKKIARRMYNKCNLLLVPSAKVEALLRKNKIKSKFLEIHLGTNTKKFKPVKDKKAAKRKIGIEPERIVIGYTGRFAREKDLKTLYKGFSKARKSDRRLLLLLVGGGIKREEELYKSKRNVIVTGPVQNVVPYLQAMDIYVLSSLTETTSLSTMEAMAAGIPSITTRVGYLKEYIKPGQNGLFFPMKNSNSLKQKILYLINNPKEREKLGKNARKTILKKYSWEKTAKEIEDALKRIWLYL